MQDVASLTEKERKKFHELLTSDSASDQMFDELEDLNLVLELRERVGEAAL